MKRLLPFLLAILWLPAFAQTPPDLTDLGAAPDPADSTYIWDASASALKEMTIANLFTTPTITTHANFGATGVRVSGANGVLTFLGLGDGSDENLLLDFNTTANTIGVSSGTGANVIDLGSFSITISALTVTTANATTFRILDNVDQSHGMSIVVASDLTDNRALTITTGDAARSITLNGNPTLNDWFDQSVKAAASPQFTGVELSHASANTLTASGGVLSIEGAAVAMVGGNTFTGAHDFGGATSVEIPNSDDPDVDAAGEISYDTDGWQRVFDGTNQVALGRKIEALHCTVIKPNDLDDSDRDAFWMWSNESGMSFIVTGWKAWSDTDDTTLNIEVVDSDGVGNNATVDAVEVATGSGPYTGSDTTITAATIANGRMLVLDFDDTDTPGQVKIVIYGYYNADVN